MSAQSATPATGAPPQHTQRGIVKMVLSGDAIVIRGPPRNGPPPERTLALSNITAPKLARRANPNVEGSTDTEDNPFAWEAREFLRKLLIGKDIMFSVEYKVQTSGREYGSVWLSVSGEPQNVTDMLVSEGLVEVRQTGRPSEENQRLSLIEAAAKASGKGKWVQESEEGTAITREVTWSMSSAQLRNFVDRNTGKEIDAIIEHVRDGSTFRAMLLPTFHVITLALSGIKCPTIRREGDKEIPEAFSEMARFFSEARLLQREVKVLLEGVSNQLALGTILHPAGNISELLLKEGFARCVDWSMAVVTTGREKLRAAEKGSKEQHLRIWKDYQPSTTAAIPKEAKNFTGKVIEIVNADALVVKLADGSLKKIHFSSLRPPRLASKDSEDRSSQDRSSQRMRPLYDVPYMFEAREFLRKKLIGKKVNVTVDYLKPAQDSFPERTCCTVNREAINISEALISKGLATCLRHRQDDDQRSSLYDDLLAAEARAVKNNKGVHSKKESPIHKVSDLSGDQPKAKQFLPFLQRAGKTVALVEFVASGTRVRLFLPKDTCLINFILAGVSCPRAGRQDGNGGEPLGQEALQFTKELVMHREVEVEVEASDKGGNFIGWLYIEGKNLSVTLVEEGLSKVLPQAERSPHGKLLFELEDKAKAAKKGVWEDYVEPAPAPVEESQEESEPATTDTDTQPPPERKTNYKKMVVSEVVSSCHFWAQLCEQGPKLNDLMKQLQSDLAANPPLPGSFTPKKGSLCVAQFSGDGLWYRASIEKVQQPSSQQVQVLYIDFGNHETLPSSKLAVLPGGYNSLPAQAKELRLACVISPDDEDWSKESYTAFCTAVMDKVLLANIEYRVQGQEYVSLQQSADNSDVAENLVKAGLMRVERRREKKLMKLITDYFKAEEDARKNRRAMWCYGDMTPDDCREFGYQK